MSLKQREERLKYVEALLEAVIEKKQSLGNSASVKTWQFVKLVQEKLGVTEKTAIDYVNVVKTYKTFDTNGMDLFLRGKKPRYFD